jgi:hypothetical protein
MPVNGVRSGSLQKYDDAGGASSAHTHNFGSAYASGKTLLQLCNENEDKSVVNTYVSAYVQAGTPSNGAWPVVSGPSFTSITYRLDVYHCEARALWETFFY